MQCREALDWLLLPEQGFDATLHLPPGRTFHLPAPAGLAKLDVAHRGILFVRPSVDKHCAVQADFPMTGLQGGDLKAKIIQVENVGGASSRADHGLRRLGNDQICIRIVWILTVVLLMKLGGRTRRAGKDEPVFVVVLRGHPVQVDGRFQDRLKALPVLLNSKASKPAFAMPISPMSYRSHSARKSRTSPTHSSVAGKSRSCLRRRPWQAVGTPSPSSILPTRTGRKSGTTC